MPHDIPDEDIVYVPKVRKSTIERLHEEGFIIGPTVTLRSMGLPDLAEDPDGVAVDFVCMKRKHRK